MKAQREGINALAKPSGTGCVECLATGSWWFHLRRCTECGHIGCYLQNQHASKHHATTGHRLSPSQESGGFTIIVQVNFSPARPFPLLIHTRQINPCPDRAASCRQIGKHCFMNRLPFKQVKQPATRCGP